MRMRPRRRMPTSSERAEVRAGLKKGVNAVKNYGKNVIGGAKIVGSAIKKGIAKGAQFLAKPLVREFKMQDEANRINSIKGRELNREFSGKLQNKKTMDMLKRGMAGKKK